MSSKRAKTVATKAAVKKVGKEFENRDQMPADNRPVPTAIAPTASEPKPIVTERLAAHEPVTGLGTSTVEIVREAHGQNPSLTRAANTRTVLDEAIKAKIIEALTQPGANMTKIASEHGVSYSAVQGIKSKLAKATPAAVVVRRVAVKPAAPVVAAQPVEDVELMKMELDFLRKKIAYLESRKN
jgi:transposase-like protein